MDLQTSKHGFTYQMLGGLAQARRFGKTWMIGLHIYGFTSNLLVDGLPISSNLQLVSRLMDYPEEKGSGILISKKFSHIKQAKEAVFLN